MSMRRSHIPPTPPRQAPNEWQLAVFSLGSLEFTGSAQALVAKHMQRHANRASTWREKNGEVTDIEPLDIASVWELPGQGIRIVRGAQEKNWGETVFRSLTRPLMGLAGWTPNHAVLMAAWGAESVEVNLTRLTPQAALLIPYPASSGAFMECGLSLEEAFQSAIGNGFQDPEQVMRSALSEAALPRLSKTPGWEEAKQAALERRLPIAKPSGFKPRF